MLSRAAILGSDVLLAANLLPGQVRFQRERWALSLEFPGEPMADVVMIPSAKGDSLADRHTHQSQDEVFLALRLSYPLAPTVADRALLHKEAIETVMNARPGRLRADEQLSLGDYPMQRLLVEMGDRRTFREVRLVLIGASLYFVSVEWAGGAAPSERARRFLAGLSLRPEFANPAAVAERERWREVVQGPFRLRYDASRWFRDPQPSENPGTIVLLRGDELAEAEFVTSSERLSATSMEEVVIGAARASAESVKVLRRAKKYRGSVQVEELRFTIRSEGVNYENLGCFYNGAEGTAQLRAWSPEASFREVEGDIAELLGGLSVVRATPSAR